MVDSANNAELLEQQLNAVRFKNEYIQLAGGLLDAEAVRLIMGYSTDQAVHKAAAKRCLLAVEDGARQRFPRFQFDDVRVLTGIRAILKEVPNTNGWRILQYLYSREYGLKGDRPIDIITRSRADLERAVLFARRLEQ
jgi:hypothetical protein